MSRGLMNTSTEENVPAVLKVKYKHIGLFKEHIQAKRKEVQSRVKYISKHGLLKGIPGSQSQPPLLWDRTVAVHNLLEQGEGEGEESDILRDNDDNLDDAKDEFFSNLEAPTKRKLLDESSEFTHFLDQWAIEKGVHEVLTRVKDLDDSLNESDSNKIFKTALNTPIPSTRVQQSHSHSHTHSLQASKFGEGGQSTRDLRRILPAFIGGSTRTLSRLEENPLNKLRKKQMNMSNPVTPRLTPVNTQITQITSPSAKTSPCDMMTKAFNLFSKGKDDQTQKEGKQHALINQETSLEQVIVDTNKRLEKLKSKAEDLRKYNEREHKAYEKTLLKYNKLVEEDDRIKDFQKKFSGFLPAVSKGGGKIVDRGNDNFSTAMGTQQRKPLPRTPNTPNRKAKEYVMGIPLISQMLRWNKEKPPTPKNTNPTPGSKKGEPASGKKGEININSGKKVEGIKSRSNSKGTNTPPSAMTNAQLDLRLQQKAAKDKRQKDILVFQQKISSHNILLLKNKFELEEYVTEMEKLKARIAPKKKELLNHYQKLLKEGKDHRLSGLSWIIKKIWQLHENVNVNYMPVFLEPKSVEYLLNCAKIELKISEYKIRQIEIIRRQKAMTMAQQAFFATIFGRKAAEKSTEKDVGIKSFPTLRTIKTRIHDVTQTVHVEDKKEPNRNGKLTFKSQDRFKKKRGGFGSGMEIQGIDNFEEKEEKLQPGEIERLMTQLRSQLGELKTKEAERLKRLYVLDLNSEINPNLIARYRALFGEEMSKRELDNLRAEKEEYRKTLEKNQTFKFQGTSHKTYFQLKHDVL